MCDPNSFISAGSSIGAGMIESRMIKSKANFEVAQLEAMKTLASARQSSQESEIRLSIADAWQANTSAIALSGFGSGSFDSIKDATVKDVNRGIGKLEANTKAEKDNLKLKQSVTNISANLEASMAKQAGYMDAFSTLTSAYTEYKKNNTNPKLDGKQERLKKQGKSYVKSGRAMDGVIGKRASKFLDKRMQPFERRFKSFFDGED